MELQKLEHININVSDLDASVQFYKNILGMKQGERPNFKNPGAWLYLGETAVVHLTHGRSESQAGSGTLDHLAFRASDLSGFTESLKDKKIEFEERRVPDQQQHQVFFEDPDGITIEIVFETESDINDLTSR
jgi:catechol 2,3-dioxygenase-like lactoylglutathione lyase family enzyme